MQIDDIHIRRFLSFDSFDWSDIDSHLNIIVGPNGAGKTNILHAVRAVKDALNPVQGKQTLLWTESAYRGANTRSIEISLDIQFTGEWEQKLLLAFLSSTLCNDKTFHEDQVGGKSKVRIGRYIAAKYECPDEVANLLDSMMEYLRRSEQKNGRSKPDMGKHDL